jgi:hypothetical protein
MLIDHERINNNGWRQGSVFGIEDSRNLLVTTTWRPQPGNIPLPVDTRLIAASHSCDIVSRCEHELQVEVCPALPLANTETPQKFGYARNARRLRLPIQIEGDSVLHDLHAPLRFTISRDSLEHLKPDPNAQIADCDFDDYSFWLAARVRRRTFPDAFDARLTSNAHDRIRKVILRIGKHIDGLLYSLSTNEELGGDTPYRLRVVILAKSSEMQEPGVMKVLETAKDDIEGILSGRKGIALEGVTLASSSGMNVSNYMKFSSWGFEDVSLELDSDLPSH